MAFTLWLRCGADGVRPAGDPAAHRLFMLLLLKAQHNPDLMFDVKTLNEARPPPEFKEAGLRKAPALQLDEDTGLSLEDDIVQELDRYPPRTSADDAVEAEDATADFFRQFAYFIKDVNKGEKALLTELRRIDQFLQNSATRFLISDEISDIDCLVLPRLHSIRIAAKTLKDLDIPEELENLWKYLKNGYESKLFTTSCPCDQEIVLHWADRPGMSVSQSKKSALSRQTASFTTTAP